MPGKLPDFIDFFCVISKEKPWNWIPCRRCGLLILSSALATLQADPPPAPLALIYFLATAAAVVPAVLGVPIVAAPSILVALIHMRLVALLGDDVGSVGP